MSLTSLITVTFPQDSSYGPNDTFTVAGKTIGEPETGITKSQLESGYLYPHNNEETVGYTVTPTLGECVGQIVLEGDIAVTPSPAPSEAPSPAPSEAPSPAPSEAPSPAPATPTPSPAPTPSPTPTPSLTGFLVTYHPSDERIACDAVGDENEEFTIYSECETLSAQCVLKYGDGTTVDTGYYVDVSSNPLTYYETEGGGIIIGSGNTCSNVPTPTPVVIECFLLPVETSATLSDMCNGVTTPEDGYFDTNNIATATIYYGLNSCANEDPGTKYFFISEVQTIQYRVWSGGVMSQILTCDSPPE